MPGTTVAVQDSDGKPIQSVVKDFTPVLDTSQYADGDVLFVAKELTLVTRKAGMAIELHSLVVTDGDDQNVGFDLVFSNASITLGTLNSAVSISDSDAAKIIGVVSVTTSDMVDLINSRLFYKANIGQMMQLASDQTSIWISGISRSGTPTYSASGMKMKLGFIGI